MKKLIIFALIFSIVAVSITGALIIYQNRNVTDVKNPNIISGDKEQDIVTKPIVEEKTIDLYGTYDENDLKLREKSEMIIESLGRNFSIPFIEGLKNKNVENKINNDMRDKVIECIEEVSKKNGVKIIFYENYFSEYYHDFSNFSNVISFYGGLKYEINGEEFWEMLTFNYELISGERLKFEDLLKKDTDLHSIVRQILYRSASKNVEIGPGEMGTTDVYYDQKDGKWKYKEWKWNEYGDDNEVEIEYVPPLSEYDINKMIKSFMSKDEKEFYFSPTKLYLVMNENTYSYYIYLKDIADEVVIYDKYATEESLYKLSDIGRKNIWTCAERLNSDYIDYGFAEDNLYYEVISRNYYDSSYEGDFKFKRSLEKLSKDAIEVSRVKIEEYKKIARENSDKFYILYINIPTINRFFSAEEKHNYLISSDINEYLTSTDISYKEKVMDDLLESYRYHNLGFYGSAMELSGYSYDKANSEYYEGDILFDSFKKKEEEKIYNAKTLKEITSLDEIFKSGVDYMSILKNNTKSEIREREPYINEDELNRLVDGTKYKITLHGIKSQVPERDYYISISYDDFKESSLKIYDLNMYIIPESNSKNIEKTEIQNLTLDELNIAYNEIFARYGHDFKTKELKEYFELCPWYIPVANKSVSLEELNEFERRNLEMIKNLINEKK